MSLPEAIDIIMLTSLPLRTRENLKLLLGAFEGVEELEPTHWGPDERARNPYNREEMLDVITDPERPYVPGLRRAKPPRYLAYFTAKDPGIKMVKVQFGSGLRKKDPPLIFKLADALATTLEPEYG